MQNFIEQWTEVASTPNEFLWLAGASFFGYCIKQISQLPHVKISDVQ